MLSTVFFTALYMLGLEKDFIVTAFLASILIDLDHLFLANKVGSLNPLKIYRYCINFTCPTSDFLLMKFGGIKFLPLHNLPLCFLVILVLPAIGFGMLFHIISDIIGHGYLRILNNSSEP